MTAEEYRTPKRVKDNIHSVSIGKRTEYLGACPTCGKSVSKSMGDFCNHCGQALSWPENMGG